MADEAIVHETAVLLAGKGRGRSETRTQDFETCPLPDLGIDPHVEVAVNDATGPEILINLEENILRMGLQKDPSFTEDPGPALENRNHDLVDHERLRFGAQ